MRSIDLNVDAGEGFGAWPIGNDAALFRIATSANLACGFHAGDPATIRIAVELALEAGISIGAHPGLPDRVGFGRRFLALTPLQVRDDTLYQVGALAAVVGAAGGRLNHVKAHGALATAVVEQSPAHAEAFLAAVRAVSPALALIAISGSLLAAAAVEVGHPMVREAFPDRAYRADGTVVPRSQSDAIIDARDEVARRAVVLAAGQGLRSRDDTELVIEADTLTIHGDHPGAVESARGVRAALEAAGVSVEAFSWAR